MAPDAFDRFETLPTATSDACATARRGSGLVLRLGNLPIGGKASSEVLAVATAALAEKAPGLRHLVLDLSRTRTISSMGLGLCVDLRNRAVARGLSPILAGTSGDLLDVFRMMKLERLFTVVRSDRDLRDLLGE